jgi:hypothetical protein
MTEEDIKWDKKVVNGLKSTFANEKKVRWYQYLFTALVDLILLYIVNNLIYWNLSFISSSYTDVLWALNLTIFFTLVGNVSFILYDPPWFKHLVKIIINFTALYAAYIIYVVFPFTISQNYMVIVLKILIILAIIAAFISIIVEIFKFLYAFFKSP